MTLSNSCDQEVSTLILVTTHIYSSSFFVSCGPLEPLKQSVLTHLSSWEIVATTTPNPSLAVFFGVQLCPCKMLTHLLSNHREQTQNVIVLFKSGAEQVLFPQLESISDWKSPSAFLQLSRICFCPISQKRQVGQSFPASLHADVRQQFLLSLLSETQSGDVSALKFAVHLLFLCSPKMNTISYTVYF